MTKKMLSRNANSNLLFANAKHSLLEKVISHPWAIRWQNQLVITQSLLGGDMQASAVRQVSTPDGGEREMTAQPGYAPLCDEAWIAADRALLPVVPENTTVLMVWGMLGRAWTDFEKWLFDAIDVDDMQSAIEAAPEGHQIVLWFRSPGGIINGIPENAAYLRKISGKRRLLAFTDDLCASAAYWLACQCQRIDATPTANVGSIGVYLAMYDYCALLEKMGVKLEMFRSGKFKGRGTMGLPLSDEDKAQLQASVNEAFSAFKADVLRNRTIADEHMEGQTLRGKQAQAANLVDGFFPSATDYFAALAKGKI